jgi:hypothetical protein
MTERLATFLAKYMEESVSKDSAWLFPSALTKDGKPKSKSGYTEALQKPFRIAAEAAVLDPAQRLCATPSGTRPSATWCS